MVHAPFAIAKRLGCVASPLWGRALGNVVSIWNLKTMLIPGRWLSGGFPDEGFMHYVMIQSLYAFWIPAALILLGTDLKRLKLFPADCPWARNGAFMAPFSSANLQLSLIITNRAVVIS